jgi:hypothetical protein
MSCNPRTLALLPVRGAAAAGSCGGGRAAGRAMTEPLRMSLRSLRPRCGPPAAYASGKARSHAKTSHRMMIDAKARNVLDGGGEMGALMRVTDWTKSAVGPVERWPQSLRTAPSILLETAFPMYIAWGKKDFTQFYNDGYRPILGSTKRRRAGSPKPIPWPSGTPGFPGPSVCHVPLGSRPTTLTASCSCSTGRPNRRPRRIPRWRSRASPTGRTSCTHPRRRRTSRLRRRRSCRPGTPCRCSRYSDCPRSMAGRGGRRLRCTGRPSRTRAGGRRRTPRMRGW